jgi:capsid portal protein
MMLMCSNGRFTKGTIDRITDYVTGQIQGSDNYSRWILVEAEGQFEGEDPGNMKISAQPLTNEQMRDQMFQMFGDNNRKKIRTAFRLAAIFLGDNEEITKANAEAGRKLTDEQVYGPERDAFDDDYNRLILVPELGAVYHRLKSRGPNVTDDEDLIRVLMAAEKTGGLTPRIAREITGAIMGKELPAIDPKKLDPDIPFSMQLAQAVKNQANAGAGGPPLDVGNQVTALKALMASDPFFSAFTEAVYKAADGRSLDGALATILKLRTEAEAALATHAAT